MGYNTKIYKDDGGDTLHIGGKVVIDEGADMSALAEALARVNVAKVGVAGSCGGKSTSDFVSDDCRILHGGVVVGTINHVTGCTAFGKDEQDGNFFPFKICDDYKGKNISCKRISGTDGKEKKAQDLEWVLRLTDGEDTVFEFSTADEPKEPIITLKFKQATLLSAPEE